MAGLCDLQEKDISEKLRVELKTVELERDQLMQDKQEAESRLGTETNKRPGSEGLESMGIKSSFLTRKLEDKVKSLELEVQKKVIHVDFCLSLCINGTLWQSSHGAS